MSTPCQMPSQLHTSLLRSGVPSVRDYRTPLRVCSAACIFAMAQSRCARAASSYYVAFQREATNSPNGGMPWRGAGDAAEPAVSCASLSGSTVACRAILSGSAAAAMQAHAMPCQQIYMQHCSSRRTCWQRCGMIGMPSVCMCGLTAIRS